MSAGDDDPFNPKNQRSLAESVREADTLFLVIGLLVVVGAIVIFGVAAIIAMF